MNSNRYEFNIQSNNGTRQYSDDDIPCNELPKRRSMATSSEYEIQSNKLVPCLKKEIGDESITINKRKNTRSKKETGDEATKKIKKAQVRGDNSVAYFIFFELRRAAHRCQK